MTDSGGVVARSFARRRNINEAARHTSEAAQGDSEAAHDINHDIEEAVQTGTAQTEAMPGAPPSQMYAFPGQAVRNEDASAPHPVAKRRRLTMRQEEFCEYYLFWGNAAQAARSAGYSLHSARKQAYRLLTNAYILERIAELRRDLGAGNRIDRDTYLAKLEACYRQALSKEAYGAALRAAEAQARFAGLMPGRSGLKKASEGDPADSAASGDEPTGRAGRVQY